MEKYTDSLFIVNKATEDANELASQTFGALIAHAVPVFGTLEEAQQAVKENPRDDDIQPAYFKLTLERVYA